MHKTTRALASTTLPRILLLVAMALAAGALSAAQDSSTSDTPKATGKSTKKSPVHRATNGQTATATANTASKATPEATDQESKSSPTDAKKTTAVPSHKSKTTSIKKSSAKSSGKTASAHKSTSSTTTSGSKKSRSARSIRMQQAFVASTELRPMAQQLSNLRTEVAYSAVNKYAHAHTGEAAAAAYLALGHAYLLDQRYKDAAQAFAESRKYGSALAEYAEFLGAQAEHGTGNDEAAAHLLSGFKVRYPDSVFSAQAPELEAQVLIALQKYDAASAILAANKNYDSRIGYQLALAKIESAKGQTAAAIRDLKHLILTHPAAKEAEEIRLRLNDLGAAFTADERRQLADAYFAAKRWSDAADLYHTLAHDTNIPTDQRNSYAVSEAACNLKLKRLTESEAKALPDSHDEGGAHRLYLLMELARNSTNLDAQRSLVARLKIEFPTSRWTAEALFSSGNLYLLRREYPEAVANYSYLALHFPENTNASAANWRAGWLTYRSGDYAQAAALFDAQIAHFPTAKETVSALYWRARLYQTQDHRNDQAASLYRQISRRFPHFFYAQMARQRLAAIHGEPIAATSDKAEAAQENALTDSDTSAANSDAPAPAPSLTTDFPDTPHLERAELLANAGLNDYIANEIAATPDSGSWSALAEARIYQKFGETYRAMRAIKRAVPGAMSTEIPAIPLEYWRILFPEPWWNTIKAESAKYNLDPYLVAALIRQESEFNPSVVSHANAWGLMQLLPSVGKQMAKEEGIENFEAHQLLDPETNIRLGTRYFSQMLNHFGGVVEYALAAYNAGESRVTDWRAAGTYSGMDEFVESIPFTETREYVQAIDRNVEIYRSIDAFAAKQNQNTPASSSR